MKKLPVVVFALVATLFPGGCLMADPEDDVIVIPDIVYGRKDGLALTLDVFQPAEANGAALLFVVSGGWISRWSPPGETAAVVEPYLARGLTVFAVRHGNCPPYGIPDAVGDLKRAIRFVRASAGEYGVDRERIGVLGMSAGAHLALMLAATGEAPVPESEDPFEAAGSEVKTAVALVPPADLRLMVWESEASLPIHRKIAALNLPLEEAEKVSPVDHVTKDDASMLIVSATKDEIVLPVHARRMAEALEKSGVRHRVLSLDTDHGLAGKQEEILKAVLEWIDRELAPSKETE